MERFRIAMNMSREQGISMCPSGGLCQKALDLSAWSGNLSETRRICAVVLPFER